MKRCVLLIALLLSNCLSFAQMFTIYRGGIALPPIYSSLGYAVSIAMSGDSIVFSPSTFSWGQAVAIISGKDLILQGTRTATDSTVFDNGHIQIENIGISTTTHITIRDITFTNGYGSIDQPDGGAITAEKNTELIVTGHSVFYGNIATGWVFGGRGHGGAIYSKGKVLITGNTIIASNTGSSGGGVYCTKDLTISGNAVIKNNTAYQTGGGIYVLGPCILKENVTIENNDATVAGGVYCHGNCLISDNVIIDSNNAGASGGGIYADRSNITISNGCMVAANNAGYCGGGIYMNYSNLDIKDSVVIGFNNCNIGAGIFDRQGNVFINGGQIIGNKAYDTSFLVTGAAINVETSTIPVNVTINNARIFNPAHNGSRQNEIYNGSVNVFSSDSTWWGESDTTGLIYNNAVTTFNLNSWVIANWSINGGLPIGTSTSFPVEALFTLNDGSTLLPGRFWMLYGNFSASDGTFSPTVAGMVAATNIVGTIYKAPIATSSIDMTGIIDADTFKSTEYVTGLDISQLANVQKQSYSIYPNPSSDGIINITQKVADARAVDIIVYNMQGSVVYRANRSFSGNTLSFHLGDIPAGLYLMQVTDGKRNAQRIKFTVNK